jgi:hypothetical protein
MNLTMKLKIALVIAVLAFALGKSRELSAQTLQFCENVSSTGEAISSSTLFNIDQKGGSLKMLTVLPYRLGSTQVIYDIYKVDPTGEEKYDNTIYQDSDAEWTWFWKEVTFYSAGRFNVYVYDRDRNFLTSGQVRIQYY